MASGVFHRALRGESLDIPPIWLMRQAGRYHAHYQALRKQHRFETLCRDAELAAEVAMGPVQAFDFDAAILFSDLLFPLEALGFGLSYDEGPPQLDGTLTFARIERFRPQDDALARLAFQGDAMRATRARLSPDKGLLGFVGGPWTLFVYAVEGTHSGALARAKASLELYRDFADRMVPLLIENIRLQFAGGADIVMLFDTAAGELDPGTFRDVIAPDLAAIARAFPRQLGYYAKGLKPAHLGGLEAWSHGAAEAELQGSKVPRLHGFPDALAGIGVDKDWDLAAALAAGRERHGFVQGNFDPLALKLTGPGLDEAIDRFLAPMRALSPAARRGWICGLGHGVLPGTPEDSVRRFVDRVRAAFSGMGQ